MVCTLSVPNSSAQNVSRIFQAVVDDAGLSFAARGAFAYLVACLDAGEDVSQSIPDDLVGELVTAGYLIDSPLGLSINHLFLDGGRHL